MTRLGFVCALILGAVTPLPAQRATPGSTGQAADTVAVHVLEPLVVEGRIDDLTGTATTASQGLVGYRDLRLRPLVREGELLETVPGLILTQHSGDGKSNQMFLRGFNLDHGTDFSTRVEGMPVNKPTHAHGQGYTDLNFIIPELIDHVEYKLGTYYADIGDFGAAGGAELRLRRRLDQPLASSTIGEDGYRRVVAAASAALGRGDLLVGGELKRYDGPWNVPQDLSKRAGMARYTWGAERNAFSLTALAYRNAWAASDQIPGRLARNGTIGRFAQVDSTLGGESARFSLSGTWMRAGPTSSQRLDLYGIYYDLDLYSNFTYYLDDPLHGDQIQQEDDGRRVLGMSFAHVQPAGRHEVTLGVQSRIDLVSPALRRTRQRQALEAVREDDVTQWSSGAYVQVESDWTPTVRTVLGLRGDYYAFDVRSDLEANSGREQDGLLTPKASLIVRPDERAEVYISGGFGFHSNDARGTVQSIDPVTGEAVDPVDPLVTARGAEIGLRAAPTTGLRSSLALWAVALDSELLFVGDAGTTEPSHPSRRFGLTWANFYRITPRLNADLDVSFARARFHDVPRDERHVPGALENTLAAGVSWEPEEHGPFAAIRVRHFGAYPLTEDDSVRASSASLLNLNAGWSLGSLRLGVSVLNLLNARDADIQYFYASRLLGEPETGIEDVHFHPVEPRQFRVNLSWGL